MSGIGVVILRGGIKVKLKIFQGLQYFCLPLSIYLHLLIQMLSASVEVLGE